MATWPSWLEEAADLQQTTQIFSIRRIPDATGAFSAVAS
jgi:hypothetical protein